MTQNKEKNQLTETDLGMTQVINLEDKNIKTVIAVFHVFKQLEEQAYQIKTWEI